MGVEKEADGVGDWPRVAAAVAAAAVFDSASVSVATTLMRRNTMSPFEGPNQ